MSDDSGKRGMSLISTAESTRGGSRWSLQSWAGGSGCSQQGLRPKARRQQGQAGLCCCDNRVSPELQEDGAQGFLRERWRGVGAEGGRGQELFMGDNSPAEPMLPLPFIPEAEAKASPRKPSCRQIEPAAPIGPDCLTMHAGPKILNHI